ARAARSEVSAIRRAVWSRCDVWELNLEVCELARVVAPATSLLTLDARHLATFRLARRRLAGLDLLTADERLRTAAGTQG
ncbi:MAG: hypothetical protein ABR538_18225, partial [Candidatus Binatia bacterium]